MFGALRLTPVPEVRGLHLPACLAASRAPAPPFACRKRHTTATVSHKTQTQHTRLKPADGAASRMVCWICRVLHASALTSERTHHHPALLVGRCRDNAGHQTGSSTCAGRDTAHAAAPAASGQQHATPGHRTREQRMGDGKRSCQRQAKTWAASNTHNA